MLSVELLSVTGLVFAIWFVFSLFIIFLFLYKCCYFCFFLCVNTHFRTRSNFKHLALYGISFCLFLGLLFFVCFRVYLIYSRISDFVAAVEDVNFVSPFLCVLNTLQDGIAESGLGEGQ